MKNIPIVKPMISEEEINAVVEVVKSGWLVEGKKARELEKEFADFIGIKHAITASSGTTALHLALEALDIKPGDEVITTAFTFIASSNSILFIGGVPVFADISRETYNIDPDEIKKRITDKTKAILVVHIFGLPIPNDMDGRVLMEIFEEDSEFAKRETKYVDPRYYDREQESERLKKAIRNLKLKGKI